MAKNNYLIEIQILIDKCYNLTEKNVVPNLEKTDVFWRYLWLEVRPKLQPKLRWRWPKPRGSAELNFRWFGRSIVLGIIDSNPVHCNLWKNEKFTLNEKIFRQIIYLCSKLILFHNRYFHEIFAKKAQEILFHWKNISWN